MRVLVLGGYRAVGSRIAANLRELGDSVWAAGRDPTRADRIVDLDDLAGYRQAIDDVDVVVNAGVENPMLAKLTTDDGAAFVDITATIEYISDLERLEPAGPVLVSVGPRAEQPARRRSEPIPRHGGHRHVGCQYRHPAGARSTTFTR